MQSVGEELERLALAGASTAREVVEAARPKSSPLHEYIFVCGETGAAQRYYESQARLLMRSIDVVFVNERGQEKETRALFAVTRDGEEDQTDQKVYLPVNVVASNQDQAKQIVRQAWDELQGWRRRYEQYRRIFPMFERRYRKVFAAIRKTKGI